MPKPQTRNVVLQIRVTRDEHKVIKRKAADAARTKSAYIRDKALA